MTDDDILTAIDERRFALARRELDRKIKRAPTKSFYKAANAYCSLGMGDIEMATNEAMKVAKAIPSDPRTLKILKDIFLKIGKEREAQEVYDLAARKYPNLDLLQTWFDDSFMAFDTQALQKVSKYLLAFSKAPEIVKQVGMVLLTMEDSNEEVLSSVITLEDKQSDANNQELYLKAKLLSLASKHNEVVLLLDPQPQRNLDLTILFLDALKQSLSWQKLYDETRRLIFEQEFDDYDSWKLLVLSAFKLGRLKSSMREQITQNTRNGLLARIHVDVTYKECVLQSVRDYYKVYKAKACCFSDLSAFELPAEFINDLVVERDALDKQVTTSRDKMLTLVNLELYLSQLKGTPIDWSKYEDKKDNTDLDDLYVLYLIQSCNRGAKKSELLSTLLHLEHRAKEDQENYMIRLWEMNLCNALGMTALALDHYNGLKIKMIQHETLSYKLQLKPSAANLKQLIDIYRFYLTSEAEVEHFLKKARDAHLYTKIQDLYSFGKKLKFSLSKHILVVKILEMARVLESDNYYYFMSKVKENKWQLLDSKLELFDNRDFSCDYNTRLPSVPTDIHAAEQKQNTQYVQLNYAKELLLGLEDRDDLDKVLKVFEKMLGQAEVRAAFQPYELHLLKIYLGIFKASKASAVKSRRDEQVNFLIKQFEFQKLMAALLKDVEPLSKTFPSVVAGVISLEKTSLRLFVRDTRLSATLDTFRSELKEYLQGEPQIQELKIISAEMKTGLDEAFVNAELRKLETGLRDSI